MQVWLHGFCGLVLLLEKQCGISDVQERERREKPCNEKTARQKSWRAVEPKQPEEL